MKKYKTILADPPWDLGEMRMKKARPNAKLPYPKMKTQAICALPVAELADDNCNLFLWTTHTFLPDAFEVMKAWGFRYHCLLTWDKTNGIPCWGFKRKTEFVLYGYKGKITVNQKGKLYKYNDFESGTVFRITKNFHRRAGGTGKGSRWYDKKEP